MNHLISWLNMGGYASYIWSAYGLASAIFMFHVVSIKWQKGRTKKQLKQWINR